MPVREVAGPGSSRTCPTVCGAPIHCSQPFRARWLGAPGRAPAGSRRSRGGGCADSSAGLRRARPPTVAGSPKAASTRGASARSPTWSGCRSSCERTSSSAPGSYPATLVWSSHSSGTSGQPVTAYRTIGSVVFELAALERQLGWFRIPRRARRAILARTRARRRSRRRPGPSGRFRALGERRHPRRLRGAGPSRPRSRPRSSLGLLERSQRPLVLPDHGFPEAAPRPRERQVSGHEGDAGNHSREAPAAQLGLAAKGRAPDVGIAPDRGVSRHGTPRGPGMDRMWWSPRV
jgi:hypothetical protein